MKLIKTAESTLSSIEHSEIDSISAKETATLVIEKLRDSGKTLAVAESLTGGELSSTIVEIPGASDVFQGAVVSYASTVKVKVLGVDASLIDEVGTVHPQVALSMAEGVRALLGSDFALSTTGVAGPGPSEGHAAGTVYICCDGPKGQITSGLCLDGDRGEIRQATVLASLKMILEQLSD